MDWLHAIILGIVEGITEFLPISSTGHLTIVERLMGYNTEELGIVAFTAIIQIGSIMAAVIYFWRDIARIARGWLRGLFDPGQRSSADYLMGWYVIIGSVPIALVGLVLKHQIETMTRSLWVVAAGLVIWSIFLFLADRYGKQSRKESEMGWKDAVIIGLAQCLALVPGVSRSGATIAAGLFRDIDRLAATRISFLLGIPALLAAGTLEAVSQAGQVSSTVGWGSVIAGSVAAFIVGYFAIAWLLKFISHHTFTPFVIYRIALGALIITLVTSGLVLAS